MLKYFNLCNLPKLFWYVNENLKIILVCVKNLEIILVCVKNLKIILVCVKNLEIILIIEVKILKDSVNFGG